LDGCANYACIYRSSVGHEVGTAKREKVSPRTAGQSVVLVVVKQIVDELLKRRVMGQRRRWSPPPVEYGRKVYRSGGLLQRASNEEVAATGTAQSIGTQTAQQQVVPLVPNQYIVSGPAKDDIVAGTGCDSIVTRAAVHSGNLASRK
jgi:hypothetical protein